MRPKLVMNLIIAGCVAPTPSVAIAEDKTQEETIAQLAVIESVRKKFANQLDADCHANPEDYSEAFGDTAYKIPWASIPGYGTGEPEFGYFVQLLCNVGAYNFIHRWYAQNPYGDIYPIAFARPEYDIEYASQATEIDSEILSIDVIGMTADFELVNSEFDSEKKSITEFSKWRGLGDASTIGTWSVSSGSAVLKRYEVDGSYDGKTNPVLIYDANAERDQ